MKRILLLTILLISCSLATMAQDCFKSTFRSAQKKYENGQYEKAKAAFNTALTCPDATKSQKDEANNMIKKCDKAIQQKEENNNVPESAIENAMYDPYPDTYIKFSTSSSEVSWVGGSINCALQTDAEDYSVQGIPSWCSVVSRERNNLQLKCDPNKSGSARSATITVKTSAGRSSSHRITQQQKPQKDTTTTLTSSKPVQNNNAAQTVQPSKPTPPPTLLVNDSKNPSTIYVASTGETITIKVSPADGNYYLWGVPSFATITSQDKGEFRIKFSANPNSEKRTDYLKVKYGDQEVRIDFSQYAKVSISSSSQNSSSSGGIFRNFNKRLKSDIPTGGYEFAYFQKSFRIKDDSGNHKFGMFKEGDIIHGLQTGFVIEGQFGDSRGYAHGFGMDGGLFYEYNWLKSDDQYNDNNFRYYEILSQHGIYIPLHFRFTFNFDENFTISAFGGIGANTTFSSKTYYYDASDDEKLFDENTKDNTNAWRWYNFTLEYGFAIRIVHVQFDVRFAKGINKWGSFYDGNVFQDRPLTIGMSFIY